MGDETDDVEEDDGTSESEVVANVVVQAADDNGQCFSFYPQVRRRQSHESHCMSLPSELEAAVTTPLAYLESQANPTVPENVDLSAMD